MAKFNLVGKAAGKKVMDLISFIFIFIFFNVLLNMLVSRLHCRGQRSEGEQGAQGYQARHSCSTITSRTGKYLKT